VPRGQAFVGRAPPQLRIEQLDARAQMDQRFLGRLRHVRLGDLRQQCKSTCAMPLAAITPNSAARRRQRASLAQTSLPWLKSAY
jgi:hypothetical protein